MSSTSHYPRTLVLCFEKGQHFVGIGVHFIPTATLDPAQLCYAPTIVLVPITPAHIGLGPRAAHLKELVHLGLDASWA